MLFTSVLNAAKRAPEQPLVLSARQSLSYADCLARSEELANGFRTHEISRMGCAVEDPFDIVTLLVASTATSTEACIYPRGMKVDDIFNLANSLKHDVVISDQSLDLPSMRVLRFSELCEAGSTIEPTSTKFPVMILTTGTTGAPKGTRHEWSRLSKAVRHPDRDRGERWLLTYNLNQFAGIQVLLHVILGQGTLVVPSSRRTTDVLQAMEAHQVTHVSGTPTFWRLFTGGLSQHRARELKLKQITLGGEAAPESLLVALSGLFPEARISHVYAGSEFGSAVSVGDGLSGLPLSVLTRSADAATQMRIVDGELQVRSKVGMLGYHENSDLAEEWHPTGDLVEIRGKRIHFVGRTTDIINVGGAKVHPLPIEEAALSVPGVELALAYGRPNPVTGQIVSLDVVAEQRVDRQLLEADIREACSVLPPAGHPRRIRFVSSLQTRGEKLVRPVPAVNS